MKILDDTDENLFKVEVKLPSLYNRSQHKLEGKRIGCNDDYDDYYRGDVTKNGKNFYYQE